MTIDRIRNVLLAGSAITLGVAATATAEPAHFQRLATYPVYLNLPAGIDPKLETVAEIVAATPDGMMLVYTDGPGERVGMVDIADAAAPVGAGAVHVGGEPTSVAVAHDHAYAGVNTSESFVAPSGHLAVIGLDSAEIVATCAVAGQPDSIAISPDGAYLAIAVENERDEDLNDGILPQLPAGHLAIFTLGADGVPANCDAVTTVDLTGLAEIAPSDPEPEFVDVNADNIAVVTVQENNHIVLVDLATARVTGHFPAGSVDLAAIDNLEDGIVAGADRLSGLAREPDAVSWIGTDRIVTANEGDYFGGSRGFTVFSTTGEVLYDSAELMEHLGMSLGHYPEGRAENKGVEPEGIEVAAYGEDTLIFVSAERANFVAVFADSDAGPELLDVLPTAVGPEGLLAIPGRDLFVVATEVDAEEDGLRGTLGLYARTGEGPVYPTLVSDADPATGAPIGWGAMSGLIADPDDAKTLYAVNDSVYAASRIYSLDVGQTPARITDHVDVTLEGVLKGYDLEGIALRPDGSFWAVSEGRLDRDLHNLLLQIAADGTVEAEIKLPEAVEAQSVRFGFEGVAAWGDKAIVAIQRSWNDDPADHVKLAVYHPATEGWSFVLYPLAQPSSARGGWVGLSEITAIGNDRFLLIERDNQPGSYATHKVVTHISLEGIEPAAFGGEMPVVEKTVVADLLPLMRASNGWISDKPEGLAVTADGTVLVITDNDGVDDASGETLLLTVGNLNELM